jgi:hypothetical protein
MATYPNLPLVGTSKKTYNFTVYPKSTTFTAVGGIYAITRRYQKEDGKFSHDTIYIGQTGNLSERFDNHHRIACFNRHNWTSICVHRDDNEQSRLAKEKDLIGSQNPPCNRD